MKQPDWLQPFLFVCALSAIAFFWDLGKRDLWGADEMRYASTVREMLENGDWIAPKYNRADDGEKPPLFYWLGAITAKARGQFDELATLIPSALGGLLALWFTLLLGQRLLGHPGGYFASAMLATTLGFSWQSRIGQIDSLFTGLLMGSLYGFLSALQSDPGKRHRYLLLGYATLGLAWMAKGPASIVLVGVAGLAYFLFVEGRRRPKEIFSGVGRLGLWWGIPLFLLIVAPWYVALGLHQPNGWDVVWRLLYTQNVQRYSNFTWETHDSRAVYLRAFTDLLPWTPAFFFAAVFCWKADAFQAKERRFAVAWFAAVFLFFFLSESRRTAYLVPIYPTAMLLAASVWIGGLRAADPKRALSLSQGFCVWFVTVGAGAFCLYQVLESQLPSSWAFPFPEARLSVFLFLPVLLAGVWASRNLLRKNRVLPAFAVWVSATLLTEAIIFSGMIPAVDLRKSRKKEIADLVAPVPAQAKLWCLENERPWMIYYTPHLFAGYREGDRDLRTLLEKGDYVVVGEKAKARAISIHGERLEIPAQTGGKAPLYLLRLKAQER